MDPWKGGGARVGGRGDAGRAARVSALAPLVLAAASPADLRATEEAFAPLESALGHPESREWGLEPATLFDPSAAFAETPPAAWPDLRPAPGGERPPGALEADLQAVASGAVDVGAVALRYRARAQARNDELRAFVTLCPPDHPQAAAGAGPLRGAVVGVKDCIEVAGLPATGGSRQRAAYVPQEDAACWARLRAAGAALAGKTNLHEFAAGTTSENEAYGPVRNPLDPARVAGGSSGGSAAAVAAGMAAGAVGTDTGGSVRIPAACCGVVGLKPTYGRISRHGVFPLAWSLDHVGPMAASVRDVALLYAVMAGRDPRDPATLRQPEGETGTARPAGLPLACLRGLRVAVPRSWLDLGARELPASGGLPLAPGVRAAFEGALDTLRELGATVREVDLGSPDLAVAVNRAIAFPESAAWHAPYLDAAPQRYGAAVRARLAAGRFVLAEEYLQAQRLRTRIGRRHAAALSGDRGAHLLATPTLPCVAPRLGAPPAEALALLRFCAPFNLTGWPALTLPCGPAEDGLPAGIQLVAAPWREAELLAVGATLEAALGAGAPGAGRTPRG